MRKIGELVGVEEMVVVEMVVVVEGLVVKGFGVEVLEEVIVEVV